MARFETLVLAKSDDVSITPAKCRNKKRECAMTPKGSRLECLRFRAVSVTPFLPKRRPWGVSGDVPIFDAEERVSRMTFGLASATAGGKF